MVAQGPKIDGAKCFVSREIEQISKFDLDGAFSQESMYFSFPLPCVYQLWLF